MSPDRVEEVLEYLIRSAKSVVRHQPGFVSFNFHVSADRSQIVNYGQWRSMDVLAGMRQNPAVTILMKETTEVAGPSAPTPFNLVGIFKSRGASDEGTTKLIPNNGQLTLINTGGVPRLALVPGHRCGMAHACRVGPTSSPGWAAYLAIHANVFSRMHGLRLRHRRVVSCRRSIHSS